ncbi:MAG: Ig-like domain-containing protein [Proteobacteria bacterium]|nr:Ig-like domain-containing protein [Pseudomonadota bacterium]MBU1685807.1 Ig-like domain-containing protein [Pseudomonadota bacterium]
MHRCKDYSKLWFIALLLAVFVSGCGGGGTEHWDEPQGATLVSIGVTPATSSIPMGISQQFIATATYSDGTSSDVTAVASWTSGTSSVATVGSATGLATGVAVGTSVITADFKGSTASATLTVTTVTLSSIAVTPATATVVPGLTKSFVATGTYSDGTTYDLSNTVVWSSDNTVVATVLSTTGVATGASTGSAKITATLGATSGFGTLTVTTATLSSIAVTPATATVVPGLTKSFVATGTYSDGTTHDISNTVVWSSDNTAVATVLSTTGVATGVSTGSAKITATLGATSGYGTLTVVAATLSSIAVTPATATVVPGLTKSFVATGTYSNGTTHDISNTVVWSSDNTAVATVLSTTGVATGVSTGSAKITATLGTTSGFGTLTVAAATLSSIAVTPAMATVEAGLTKSFVATGTYSDGNTADISNLVAWSSDNTAVATVLSTTGVATGVSTGSAKITATLGATSGFGTLTVAAATLSSIAVTPAAATVGAGLTQPFVAWGTYSDSNTVDISNLVAWSSDNTTVATVLSTTGVATGVSSGSAKITATLGANSGYGTLTVTTVTLNSIAVTPATATVEPGFTKSFIATATYSDYSTADISNMVEWSSDNTLVATVLSTTGVATGVSSGSAQITATLGANSGSGTLTVTATIALDANPIAPSLGESGRFVILASQTITTTTGSAISNGDLGITDQARSYYAGFTTGASPGAFDELTNGLSYGIDDANPAPYPYPLHYSTPVVGAAWTTTGAMLTQAKTDVNIADSFLAADPNPNPLAATQVCPTQLGGQVLTRGVYKTAENVLITTGPLHLDAQGDPDSVFIFSISGTLTTGAPGGNIILDNGAQAKNIFFRTAGLTEIGAGTIFYGNIFAKSQIIVLAGANITGSLYAMDDQVSLISDTITKAP